MRSRTLALTALTVAAAGALAPWAEGAAPPKEIVFGRSTGDFDLPKNNEIYVMDADGTNEIRLTDNNREDAFPNLSPDGKTIAFSRRINGQYDLFVMDVDGSNVKRLTETDPDEVLPAWSPDGSSLVYTKTFALDEMGNWQSDIFRMRLDDQRSRRITDTGKTKEFAPDWAPDGTSIAFTKQNNKREKYGIAVSEPTGDNLRWLVINPESKSGYTDVNPSWSPDSQWVAFSRDHGADPYVDIYKIRADGTDLTAVTEMNALAENPVWGGNDIIVFSYNEGLAVVPAAGGEVQTITETMTGRPYWWPDW